MNSEFYDIINVKEDRIKSPNENLQISNIPNKEPDRKVREYLFYVPPPL